MRGQASRGPARSSGTQQVALALGGADSHHMFTPEARRMDDPNTVSPEVQDFGPSHNLLDDKPRDDSSPDAARVLDDLFSQQHVLDDVPIIQKAALSRAQSSHQSVVARHRRKRDRRSIGVGAGANRAESSRS